MDTADDLQGRVRESVARLDATTSIAGATEPRREVAALSLACIAAELGELRAVLGDRLGGVEELLEHMPSVERAESAGEFRRRARHGSELDPAAGAPD